MALSGKTLKGISEAATLYAGEPRGYYILFADLCNSTDFKIYCREQEIPDGHWIERQLIFLHRTMTTIKRCSGLIIKTIGDEVMACFPKNASPDGILKCAIDCHSLFSDIKKYDNDKWRITCKISIDYGEVHDSNFGLIANKAIDPIGIIVDRCARLNSKAKSKQVFFSSSFFSMLNRSNQKKYSKLKMSEELKGIGLSEFYGLNVS